MWCTWLFVRSANKKKTWSALIVSLFLCCLGLGVLVVVCLLVRGQYTWQWDRSHCHQQQTSDYHRIDLRKPTIVALSLHLCSVCFAFVNWHMMVCVEISPVWSQQVPAVASHLGWFTERLPTGEHGFDAVKHVPPMCPQQQQRRCSEQLLGSFLHRR